MSSVISVVSLYLPTDCKSPWEKEGAGLPWVELIMSWLMLDPGLGEYPADSPVPQAARAGLQEIHIFFLTGFLLCEKQRLP